MKSYNLFITEEISWKDKIFIKNIGDIFSIAVEYELCANEDPEDEPMVKSFKSVKKHIKEKTLLDIKRGKITSYKYQPGYYQKYSNKQINDFIDERLFELELYLDVSDTEYDGEYEEILPGLKKYLDNNDEDDDKYIFDYILNQDRFTTDVEKDIVNLILQRYLMFYAQNIEYLRKKLKKNLPLFYNKYNKTFKYELEGDQEKQRILEFSPKGYLLGLTKAKEQLDDFFDEFENQEYWYFNERTALHINVGIPNKKFNPLKGLMLMSDFNRDKKIPYIFKDITYRMNNRFVGSMIDGIKKLLTGELEREIEEHPDPVFRLNALNFRNWDELRNYKNYLKTNIDKLDMHNIQQLENFLNPFLIKSNSDFYIKEFGLNITPTKLQYVEFRFIGGDVKRDLVMDKLIYFCYLVYCMTDPEFKKENYYNRLYKFIEDLKNLL